MDDQEWHRPAVLIVGSDPEAQADLRGILERDDYEVESVSSAEDVAEHENLGQFLAVVLDCNLPDGDAEQLLPYFQVVAPEMAAILITGCADFEAAVKALRHGAADLLRKPVEPEVLRAAFRRISERHRMRAELAATQRKLVQSERLAAVGRTVAALSHEARNELFGIELGLRMLAHTLDDRQKALEIVRHLQDGRERLHRLFEDVRGFAAPIRLERATCDVSEVWRRAWSTLRPMWKRRDVSIDEETGDIDLTLPVDAFRLEQVFRNLFENSLAACPDPVGINVSCRQPNDRTFSIAVRDNGPGLTGDEKEHVFDAFFTTKTSGTGLGMAIVKRIVEAHGGTIGVGERAIRGAEFIITLPVSEGQPGTDACRSGADLVPADLAPATSSPSPFPASE